MATGGGFPRLKQSKSETKQRSSNWPRSVSSDKDDSLSLTSFPSDIRINNWDLSDLRPMASADSKRRKKSKGNPEREREREQSLSMDSPPHGEQKQCTPSSMSRTRNTPVSQRDALEKLKQKLTYEEEYSTDGERNNERSLQRSRRRQLDNRETEGATGRSGGSRRPRANRNNNTELGPDRNQIVGRLVQIQDYIKQAVVMMENLQKSGDSGNAEDLAKVARLITNLQEQEQGYLSLLHTNSALLAEAAGTDGQPAEGAAKRATDSEDSVDLEVQSNASGNSAESSSSSRPRIEDKLGLGSEEEEGSDDSKDQDTALDNTLLAPQLADVKAAATAKAMRNVADTLNSLNQDGSEDTGGGGELTSQQRQHLMRVMMEKQEQLRQLQSRQDQLLTMKREAEERLKQAQQRDNKARAALAAVEAGKRALDDEEMFFEQAEGQLKSNIVGYPESDDDETSNAREAADPLSELARQLALARNQFFAEAENGPRNNTEGSSGGDSVTGVGTGASTAAVLAQQQQLQDKLRDLQEKKQNMDQLLVHLESLRAQRQNMRKNETNANRQAVSPQQRQSSQKQQQRQQQQQQQQRQQQQQQLPPPPPPPPLSSASAPASQLAEGGLMEGDLMSMLEGLGGLGSLPGLSEALAPPAAERGAVELTGWSAGLEQGDAGAEMSVQEARDKMGKLQEVRQRLNQLRDLVQYYQKMKTQAEDSQTADAQSDSVDQSSMSRLEAMEEALSRAAQQSGMATATSTSSVASAAQAPQAPFMHMAGHMASAASEEQSDEDNASGSEDWGSGLGAWDRDPDVQEKVRKLKSAKDKLRDLQGLIAALETMPEAEKFADASQNSSTDPRPARPPQARVTETFPTQETDAGNMSVSEGEIPSAIPPEFQGLVRNEGKYHQRVEELERLREERQKLVTIQQQLHTLQGRFEEVDGTSPRGRADGSLRKGDGDQPSASVVTFASNDELYSKMRDQRIEREELRSKKKELEAIMKKDQNRRQYIRNQDNQSDTVSFTTATDAFGASASADATMATWGGSTVDNLENITEDEDGQTGNARTVDEDDGYPSDGIVQVEEEEEENETDNGTYTITSNGRQRSSLQQGRGQQGQGARPKTSRGVRGFPQPAKTTGSSMKHGKRPQSQPWGRVSREDRVQARQGRLWSPGSQSRPREDPTLRQFQQQLERMSSLCQDLMAPPASSGSRSQLKAPSHLSLMPPPEPAPQPEVQNQLMREMQQQQLMMAVSQCNQQLMMQQFDMAALHRQLQQLSGQMNAMQQAPSSLAPVNPANPASQAGPGVLIPQPYLSPLTSSLAAHVPNNVSTSVNVQSSRQTTFTVNPNFTSNPFSSAEAQSLQVPVAQAVQTSDVDLRSGGGGRESGVEAGPGSSFPRPMRLWEEPGSAGDTGEQEAAAETMPKMNLHTFLRARRKKQTRKQSADKNSQNPVDLDKLSGYRPGLSAGISGSGFNDTASISSLASSQTDAAVGGLRSQVERSGELGELNLFEELRETIYTEVASLISQNESRPQYLHQLFRELQGMTSDLMRQRAIFALQEIKQSTLGQDRCASSGREKPWQPWKTGQDNAASELTPSESMPTSDDEEVKARVRQHASALERKKQGGSGRGWVMARSNSLKDDKFDYVETAVTTSSLSTPTNDNGESPFCQDSLGDTVIHLDKALARMRREMQQAEKERAERVRKIMKFKRHVQQVTQERLAMEAGQDSSADLNLADQGSESSVSDMPLRPEFNQEYPPIDTQELDQQIKRVMSEVIPVIKENINNVFSPQFLSYIQRLVLSQLRQPGDSRQFSRFFYGQLGSILQDYLSKFEGRRVREVGEDVVMEMSEVLFNELAFLRIMRGLHNPQLVHKMRQDACFNPSGSKRTAALVGEDYDAGGNESDNEASDDKEEDDDDEDVTPQNVKVNGMEDEEEELGKERDDELAGKGVTQAGEEKDEDTEDPQASSAVHIQLAMSETKPFTRIGSDEDTDASDASLSLEDPSDTAVSRNTMMEHHQHASASAAASSSASAASQAGTGGPAFGPSPPAQKAKETSAHREEEKEADTSEADGTLEARGPADGSRDPTSVASAQQGGSCQRGSGAGGSGPLEVQVNGHATSPEEEEEEVPVDVDDLPPALDVADPEMVDQKRQEEDAATSGVDAVLATMDAGQELAGDGSALKEPESAGK